MPVKVLGVKYQLLAQDMDRAVAFYRDALGLELRFTSPSGSEVALGEAVVALHGGGDGSEHPTGLGFVVDDIHAATDALPAAGASLLSPPVHKVDEGVWLADLVDPEGNTFFITQVAPQE